MFENIEFESSSLKTRDGIEFNVYRIYDASYLMIGCSLNPAEMKERQSEILSALPKCKPGRKWTIEWGQRPLPYVKYSEKHKWTYFVKNVAELDSCYAETKKGGPGWMWYICVGLMILSIICNVMQMIILSQVR